MATITLNLVPFTVPTTVVVETPVANTNEGYNSARAETPISDLDAATRQELIDEFALAVLAL